MKIISLCPSNTEICATLEIDHLLIGIDDFSNYPESISHLPRLGPDLSIDMDAVEALKPDIVLASLSVPGMEKNIVELNKRNIPHIILNPNTLQEIADDIVKVGNILGITMKAKEKATLFLDEIEVYKKISNTIVDKKTLYWEWWPNPLFTPGGRNWLTEISELAGGKNIFDHVDLASVQVKHSDVINSNPDYILLSWVGVAHHRIKPEIVLKRDGWNELKAIKNGQIIVMEEDYYCRPSPRLLEGLRKLGNTLHPDVFLKI